MKETKKKEEDEKQSVINDKIRNIIAMGFSMEDPQFERILIQIINGL